MRFISRPAWGWILLACLAVQSMAQASIDLQPGLVITTTAHAGLVSSAGSAPIADTEMIYSVGEVTPTAISFGFKIAAPDDAKAADLLKKPIEFKRIVRREDLATATRINLSWGSDDPDIFPGQTFIQTSAAALNALKTRGETPFVVGINEGGLFSGAAAAIASPSAQKDGGVPANLSSLLGALGVERHYYRGVLKRVEAGTAAFPVLLNGERTTLAAVHARGTLKFSDRERSFEFYWLDEPANALTLKWVVNQNHALVTRIDTPPPESGNGHPGNGTMQSPVAKALGGKTCRAELHGIYFATGSAQLLAESEPNLKALSVLLLANPDWSVTIEGHTDNIGSAAYNLALSNRRATAVRDALMGRYRIPAARISAKGLGLTKPREPNTTEEGRARNRRVEIARACAP